MLEVIAVFSAEPNSGTITLGENLAILSLGTNWVKPPTFWPDGVGHISRKALEPRRSPWGYLCGDCAVTALNGV